MKKILLPFLVIVSILVMATYSPKFSENLKGKVKFPQEFVQGEVTKVIEEELMKDPVMKGKFRGGQTLEVKILEGKYKGETFKVYNSLSALHNVYANVGLKAIFTVKEDKAKPTVWLYNLKRDGAIHLLGAIFIGAVLVLGKLKGVKSLLALAFTGSVIIYILLPLLFKGVDPISTSILLSSLIIIVSFLLIGGYDRKTYSAIIGTISGITMAGLISYGFGKVMNLSGLNLSEGQQLLYITRDFKLQIEGLLFVSILIASLGAVMDVAMSISSSVNEIHQHKPTLSSKELFDSAMVIGRDIVGTMINTLILAFAGGSLPLMMMIWGYGMVYQQFINIPAIAIEIVNALAGSIGIIATVPITAVVSIILIKRKWEEN
ncbi:YibE/F family protein [Cetobacterium somerae]|uniref:YibE/F family protein n=1 Tax=Cetobacterium somerae TaxID=188913 RepID=UPI003D767BF7